jgi:signal transduction histidine kinase
MSGYAQLMVDSEERAQRSKYAEEIVKQFQLVTAMQREVLEFARGERSIFVRRVYLARFFQELVGQIERQIHGLPIELQTQVDSKSSARFDEARIARAIHNLVRNAIEAMGDRGGMLAIRSSRTASALAIEVADSGPGIPSAIANRLFQSFVTANKPGGTGLGLAIVKKIVDEHGGSVSVDSSEAGTVFRLILPQSKDRVSSGPNDTLPTDTAGGLSSTIGNPKSTGE